MNKLFFIIISVIFQALSFHAYGAGYDLNLVNYKIQQNAWVNTDQVLLHVRVDTLAQKQSMTEIREEVISHLNQLITGSWHITHLGMNKDKTGISKLYLIAEVRTAQRNITSLPDRLAKLSKPGTQYKLLKMDFKPSNSEIEDQKKKVRLVLYNRINQELEVLKKLFKHQNYFLHQLSFNDTTSGPIKMPGPIALGEVIRIDGKTGTNNSNVNQVADMENTSYQLQIVATAVLASKVADKTGM